jgi:putative drug exporter of the RND superfamily
MAPEMGGILAGSRALLLDATLVRMVILPSALGLLGRRSWYLPRWLSWLPRLGAEAPPASTPRG